MKALESGKLGDVLYEALSGNVGISMACMPNILGKKFRVFIPKPTPKATEVLLKALGAEVIRTDLISIDLNFINYVAELARKDGATNLNQFFNDDNFEVHLTRTAKELEKQFKVINKLPNAITSGIGTSSHITALIKYFKSKYNNVKVDWCSTIIK